MSEDGPAKEPIEQQGDIAARALTEAEARRKAAEAAQMPKELGGRKGPEPTRFGDWEKDGIISDF